MTSNQLFRKIPDLHYRGDPENEQPLIQQAIGILRTATRKAYKAAAAKGESMNQSRKPYRLLESSRYWRIFQHGDEYVSRWVFSRSGKIEKIERLRFHSLESALAYCI